jgi:hypothetical protein
MIPKIVRASSVTRRVAVDDARDVGVGAFGSRPGDELLDALAARGHRDQQDEHDEGLAPSTGEEEPADHPDPDDDQRDVGRFGEKPPERRPCTPGARLVQPWLVEWQRRPSRDEDRQGDETEHTEQRDHEPWRGMGRGRPRFIRATGLFPIEVGRGASFGRHGEEG